jgi:hypothetical protein
MPPKRVKAAEAVIRKGKKAIAKKVVQSAARGAVRGGILGAGVTMVAEEAKRLATRPKTTRKSVRDNKRKKR